VRQPLNKGVTIMKTNVKVTAIELTPAISQYLTEKLAHLNKFTVGMDDDSIMVNVEIGKTTHHHKSGDYFRTELNLNLNGLDFRTEATEGDLYASIDVAKDDLIEQIRQRLKKHSSLLRRGGRVLKSLLRGFKK